MKFGEHTTKNNILDQKIFKSRQYQGEQMQTLQNSENSDQTYTYKV